MPAAPMPACYACPCKLRVHTHMYMPPTGPGQFRSSVSGVALLHRTVLASRLCWPTAGYIADTIKDACDCKPQCGEPQVQEPHLPTQTCPLPPNSLMSSILLLASSSCPLTVSPGFDQILPIRSGWAIWMPVSAQHKETQHKKTQQNNQSKSTLICVNAEHKFTQHTQMRQENTQKGEEKQL